MSDSERRGWLTSGDDLGVESVLIGLVIGVVLVGALWLVIASMSGGDGGTSSRVTELGPAVGGSPGSTPQSASETRLERCTVVADVVQHPLQAARPALDQWKVHVGAMNKLVVGEITLQQATAFWNQTRVGAYRNIERFEDAEAHLQQRGVDCPPPRLLGWGASPTLRACAQHVAAELQALDRARTAIATWNHHMDAMEQLRLGKLSPSAATQMWLTMWQRGVDELAEYHKAATAAQNDGACDGTLNHQQPSASHANQLQPSPTSPTSPESPTASAMSEMDMR